MDWPLASGPALLESWTTWATATGSATAHTKGAWAQLTSATSRTVTGIWLGIYDTYATSTNTSTLLDLGVGAAGSETVVLSNLEVGYRGSNVGITWVFVPIRLPAGVRVAARVQSAQTSKAVNLAVSAETGIPPAGLTSAMVVDTVGTVAGSSRGTTVTSSATANTPGSWVELTASSARRATSVLLSMGANGSAAANLGGFTGSVDLGIGAAGSEAVLRTARATGMGWDTNLDPWSPMGLAVPWGGLHIPAGTRVAARMASSVTGTFSLDVSAHLFAI